MTGTPIPPLERRRIAVQATVDRFLGRPFAWGSQDCAKMVLHLLRGLEQPFPIAKAGGYTTALGARRALRRLGFADLPAALDSSFQRIAPAATVLGDVLLLPGDDPLGALVVAVGNGRVLGWHEDADGAAMLQPLAFGAAWRTL